LLVSPALRSHICDDGTGSVSGRRASMQTENRLLDDLARMANGALNTLSGLREEIENRVRERVERMLADMDMVPREEFDAVKAMAQKARAEQEGLAAKVAELERRIDELSGIPVKPKKAASRPRTRRGAPTV
jgi:BMFP domain-containing protein YqiC